MGLPDKTGIVLSEQQKQHMLQARKDAQALIDKMYKKDYPSDLENMWKALAEKANVRLPRHHHPTSSKLCKFANSLGLSDGWKEGLFGSYYKNSLHKAIDLHNSKLPDGQKESLRTMCCYVLEGNYGD